MDSEIKERDWMRQRVLFTGFQPFDGDEVNPALEAVKLLHGRTWDDVEFVGIEVPTVFGQAIEVLRGGFIHIPFLPEQVINKPAPSMSLDVIVKGLELCGLTSARQAQDIRMTAGTEC